MVIPSQQANEGVYFPRNRDIDVISVKQKATQFHIVDRAGSLPFREQPAAFHRIVASFGEGIRQEQARMAA
jgi:hypothetical protein